MCMRNVNTNAWFCKRVIFNAENEVSGYDGVLSGIVGDYNSSGELCLNMSIVVGIFAMETSKVGDLDFEFGEEYEICLRLTHIPSDCSQDVGTLIIPADHTGLYRNSKKTLELNQVFVLKDYVLRIGPGDYQLKILVRKKTENAPTNWIVQSIHSLKVYSGVISK